MTAFKNAASASFALAAFSFNAAASALPRSMARSARIVTDSPERAVAAHQTDPQRPVQQPSAQISEPWCELVLPVPIVSFQPC